MFVNETALGQTGPQADLRRSAIHAGLYLLGRQSVVALLALVGEPLIARAVGPAQYGLWVAALGLFTYARGVGSCGIDIYLIRSEKSLSPEQSHQAFTILAGLGLTCLVVSTFALPLAQSWMKMPGFSPVATGLFITLPVCLTSLVPLAMLERSLDYRRIALVDIASRVVFYGLTLALIVKGYRIWSLIAGWWAQQLLLAASYYAMTAYRPRLLLNRSVARDMVGYGLGYSASIWIYQLRTLVNPLIVGRYAGAAAVGYIGLAERLVLMLGFAKGAAWRISIPVLARIQNDKRLMCRAVNQGMTLQVLAFAPILLGFSLLLSPIVRILFGARWLPVLQIFPFVAVLYLVNSMFALHSSALYTLRQNRRVAVFHLFHICLLAGSALLLVPRMGWLGWGWAELLAIASYGVVSQYVAIEIGDLDYGFTAPVVVATSLALFWRDLGAASFLGLVALAIWPPTWRNMRLLGVQLRGALLGES